MKSSEKQARRKFTPEFKGQAVKRVLSGHQVPVVAKELGLITYQFCIIKSVR